MPNRDRVIIGLLLLYIVGGLTQGLHFVWFQEEIPLRTDYDFLARGAAIYGQCDDRYFDAVTAGSLAFATLNLIPTQPLNAVLIWAIVRQRSWRYPLQLGLASYMSYSVVFYFWQEHLGGYPHMKTHSTEMFALFYGANLPWLLGYGFMIFDAARRRMR